MNYTYTVEKATTKDNTYLVRENSRLKTLVFMGTLLEVKAWIDLQDMAEWI